jgi:DNA polymerase-3 subunit gamma/tau
VAYVSLYRKWRPQVFSDVVGQDTIVKTLENALRSRRISHAYLFAGPRGTGKTSIARILAKGLNCQTGPTATPCGECGECQTIREGTSLNVLEIDGASNRGIDDVRELRSQVQFSPINATYKVYIIDEVHMLTTEAFNALLKTLEEPPAHVVFIFATTDPHRLPPTILSRVQRFDFGRFSEQAMVERLETVARGEELEADRDALRLISQHAAGGMRDALGILEKCTSFAKRITVDTVVEVLGVALQEQVESFAEHLLTDSKVEALQIIDDLQAQGKDLGQFALAVINRLRKSVLDGDKADEPIKLNAIEELTEAVRDMRFAPDPRILLELAVLRVTRIQDSAPSSDVARLEEKVRTLEKELHALQSQLAKEREKSPDRAGSVDAPKRRIPSANDKERSAYVLEIWPDYLKRLRDERLMQCEAFLKEGTPVEAVDDTVVIAFPRDRGFHKASIEQDSHREPAERVLSKFMGKQTRFRCVFQDEAGSTPGSEPSAGVRPEMSPPRSRQKAEVGSKANVEANVASDSPKKQDTAAEEFLRASLETFGGKIISKSKEK